MKTTYLVLSVTVSLLSAGFASPLSATPVGSDVLLDVSYSTAGAVTFTATGNDPLVTDSTHSFNDGIDLAGFFTSAAQLPPSFTGSGDLTTSLSTDKPADVYNSSSVDEINGSAEYLNIYHILDSNPEAFDTGSQAFTGSETFDLTNADAPLATPGTFGNIYAGFSGDLNPAPTIEGDFFDQLAVDLPMIGEYYVIPEPSQWSLLLVGVAGLIALRRLRVVR